MQTPVDWRRPTALLQIAGATAFAAGLALTPWESENTTAAYHDALAASPDRAQAAAAVLMFGFGLMAAASFALIAWLAPVRNRWFWAGAPLVVLFATVLPGLPVLDAYDLSLAQELGRDQSVPISDAAQSSALATISGIAMPLGAILAPTLLWIGAWRAKLAPGAAPALLVLGWVVGFATFEPVVLTIGGLLLAGPGVATLLRTPRMPAPAAGEPTPATT